MSNSAHAPDVILNALRARIFRAPAGAQVMLRETEIANEFGLSRTPIRQMLQTLAYEHLLETRVGVGSVAPPLDPETRREDFDAYAQITLAAARMKTNVIRSETKITLAGVAQLARSQKTRDVDFFISTSVRSANALADVISNRILADAFRAARWRVVRWRVQDLRTNPEAFWDLTTQTLARVANAAESDDPALLMEVAAGIIVDFSTPIAAET